MEAKQILRSTYLDLLFENRNKAYGGYDLRAKYANRTRRALLSVVAGAVLLSAGPVLADRMNTGSTAMGKPLVLDTLVFQTLPPIDEPKPDIPQPPAGGPAAPTEAFVAPTITDDVVDPKDVMPSIEDMTGKIAGPVTSAGEPGGESITPGPGTGPEGPGGPLEGTGVVKDLDKIETVVDQQALFNGNLKRYLSEHLRYPDADRELGNKGRVVVQFVVNLDGTLTAVGVMKSSGFKGLDAEALRVVSRMPAWKPAMVNAHPVRSYFTLPVTFTLD